MNTPLTFTHVSTMMVPNLIIIHQHWESRMYRELGKVVKKIFVAEIETNLPPEDQVTSNKQSNIQVFFFHLIFKYLIVFIAAILERVKAKFLKEVSQMLILAIYGIFDT